MSYKQILCLIIYFFVYILISSKRFKFFNLGRTGVALFGVVLMFIFKLFSANEFISLIDWDTIILLFSLMIIIEYLDESGFFDFLSFYIFKDYYDPKKLIFLIVFLVGLSSAFFINDITCLILTPMILRVLIKKGLNPLPYLIAIATSSNIGAIIAYTGAPQNMIIGNLCSLSFSKYFILMFPLGLILLYFNYIFIFLFFRKKLILNKNINHQIYENKISFSKINKIINLENIEKEKSKDNNKIKIKNSIFINKKIKEKIDLFIHDLKRIRRPLFRRSVTVALLTFLSFFIFKPISWVALIGAVILIVISKKNETEYLKRIDWNLLIFFICLFGLIGALNESGLTIYLFEKFIKNFELNLKNFFIFNLVSLIFSNIFSNVPYVLIVKEIIQKIPDNNIWYLFLAFTSTIAGNMTLLGAVANIIVAEKAKNEVQISFKEFFMYGFPSTLILFILGFFIIYLYWLVIPFL
ncbi:MAG: SLC13 family permease [Spirochaetes bacterium]|nr:SLC13 family permease [Spirochaetota bacterium]